jgi:hypothetical protein
MNSTRSCISTKRPHRPSPPSSCKSRSFARQRSWLRCKVCSVGSFFNRNWKLRTNRARAHTHTHTHTHTQRPKPRRRSERRSRRRCPARAARWRAARRDTNRAARRSSPLPPPPACPRFDRPPPPAPLSVGMLSMFLFCQNAILKKTYVVAVHCHRRSSLLSHCIIVVDLVRQAIRIRRARLAQAAGSARTCSSGSGSRRRCEMIEAVCACSRKLVHSFHRSGAPFHPSSAVTSATK